MQSWKSGPALGRSFSERAAHLSRRTRRLIVVVGYLALPEALALFWLHGGVGVQPPPYGGYSPLSSLALLQVLGATMVLTQGWRTAIGPKEPDERQRQLRDRAAYLSYRIVGVVVVLAMVMFYGALLLDPFDSWGPITLDSVSVWNLASCFGISGICLNVLPIAVVAWIEPDPPAEI
jgi:hypothetical protein